MSIANKRDVTALQNVDVNNILQIWTSSDPQSSSPNIPQTREYTINGSDEPGLTAFCVVDYTVNMAKSTLRITPGTSGLLTFQEALNILSISSLDQLFMALNSEPFGHTSNDFVFEFHTTLIPNDESVPVKYVDQTNSTMLHTKEITAKYGYTTTINHETFSGYRFTKSNNFLLCVRTNGVIISLIRPPIDPPDPPVDPADLVQPEGSAEKPNTVETPAQVLTGKKPHTTSIGSAAPVMKVTNYTNQNRQRLPQTGLHNGMFVTTIWGLFFLLFGGVI